MADTIGSLIIDLQNNDLSPEEREMLAHPLVGGVILFARNYESREQITHLCQSIRASRPQPLIIMVDQEGGRVQRFISEFTRLPPMATFGKLYASHPDAASRFAQNCGWLMAMELLSVGVDLSLAPVLDLNKGISSVIGMRAFHADPHIVILLASAFIRGMHEAGMASTGKHFPGHGSVSLDSHVSLPRDNRMLSEIEQDDIVPFAGMIKAGISAIMAAHIIFPQVDELPVGFSHRWLQDILRKRLQFAGVIISDDLNMEGANISTNFPDRVMAAREAGCDFTLVCNNRVGAIQVLDNLPSAAHKISRDKWSVLLSQYSCHEPYQKSKRWLETREYLLSAT